MALTACKAAEINEVIEQLPQSSRRYPNFRFQPKRPSGRLALEVRDLAKSYGVPLDREHIIGHDEIPGVTAARQAGMHWDPGPYWDWDRYMQLLLSPLPSEVDPGQDGAPLVLRPGYAQNLQKGSYCFGAADCREVAEAAANFVPLHTAADPLAPLIENQYLKGTPGDRLNNWGTKLGTGPVPQ